MSWWPVGNPLQRSSTSTSLPTNCSPNLDTAWHVTRPCNITLSIDSLWQRGDWTGPNMGWFSLSFRTSWTPMKSRPLFVSVPVLSKQKTLIFPAIAILLELRQNMPLFWMKVKTKQKKNEHPKQTETHIKLHARQSNATDEKRMYLAIVDYKWIASLHALDIISG